MTNTWSGYPNGQIPLQLMDPFMGTGKYLQPDACNMLTHLFIDAAEHGYMFFVAGGEDLYRDLSRQAYWKAYWTHLGKPGNAAPVGHSNHGWGLAADVQGWDQPGAWAWLLNNAHVYGYQLLTVPTEKWHWLYVGPTTTPAGDHPQPIHPTLKGTKMNFIKSGAEISILFPAHDGTYVRRPLTAGEWARWVAIGAIETIVSSAYYAEFRVV